MSAMRGLALDANLSIRSAGRGLHRSRIVRPTTLPVLPGMLARKHVRTTIRRLLVEMPGRQVESLLRPQLRERAGNALGAREATS